MHYIRLGVLEKYPEFISGFVDEKQEHKEYLKRAVTETFWGEVETAYVRLASWWDFVGQLLDFVFFNIRQYEKDGFSSVIERIKVNHSPIYPSIKNSDDWKEILSYQKSEKEDGFKWLIRRRNLIIHRMPLGRLSETDEDELGFQFNHLENAIERKLLLGTTSEELNHLHTHLGKAANLFSNIVGLCEIGVECFPKRK